MTIPSGINRFGDLSGIGNLSTLLANAMKPQLMTGIDGYAFPGQAGGLTVDPSVNPRALSGRGAVTPQTYSSPDQAGQGTSQPVSGQNNEAVNPIAGNDSYTPMGGSTGDAQFAEFPSYGLSGGSTGQYYDPSASLPSNPAPGLPALPNASDASSGLPFGVSPAQAANGALSLAGMVVPGLGLANSAFNFGSGLVNGYDTGANGPSQTQYAVGDGSNTIADKNSPSVISQLMSPSNTIGNLVGQGLGSLIGGDTSQIDANPYANLNSNYPTGFASLVAAYGGDLSSGNPSGFDPNQAAMDANNALTASLGGTASSNPYSMTGNMLDTFMQSAGFGGAGYGYGAMGNQGAWDPRFANGGWAGGDSLPTGITT
jgi:hypothetical protein